MQSNFNVIASANGIALNPVVNFIDYYANSRNRKLQRDDCHLEDTPSRISSTSKRNTPGRNAMDENSGPYEEDPYPYNSHAAYGRSDYNVANAFKLFGLWQPTIFKNGKWMGQRKCVGGWSLSGIFNWHTGFPIYPLYNANTSGGLYYNGSGYSSLRPAAYIGGAGSSTGNSAFMQTTNPNYNGNGTTYFDAAYFCQRTPFPRSRSSAGAGNSSQWPEWSWL